MVNLSFYATPEHDCSYIPDTNARALFADPFENIDNRIYSALIKKGFRRSGSHIYRPYCENCFGCQSLRVIVNDFLLTKSYKRIINKNKDITLIEKPAEFITEHFDLYKKYISLRHSGGEMDDGNEDNYKDFLISHWSETVFIEFRKDEELLAIAVIDIIENAISAVYTFFDPDHQSRSLGTFSILKQIEISKKLGMEHLYLGYKIDDSPKMNYKSKFKPYEIFDLKDEKWLNSSMFLEKNQ